jgi:hypothetical protein
MPSVPSASFRIVMAQTCGCAMLSRGENNENIDNANTTTIELRNKLVTLDLPIVHPPEVYFNQESQFLINSNTISFIVQAFVRRVSLPLPGVLGKYMVYGFHKEIVEGPHECGG